MLSLCKRKKKREKNEEKRERKEKGEVSRKAGMEVN